MKAEITFKSVSPLFEMERNYQKPFTVRQVDLTDERFASLRMGHAQRITIQNPDTGEAFTRPITGWAYIINPQWAIIYFGR